MKKFVFLATIGGFIVCLDQMTKILIHTQYDLGESTTVIQGFFDITYVRNFGAAFGFLAKTHPGFRDTFFMLMPPTALMIILFILKGVEDNDKIQVVALSMVFGGAVGNYIDRLHLGYVVDFLDFYVSDTHWPAFNVADMAIVCGVAILLVLMFFQAKPQIKKVNT
ncbi:MAG: signal peptidase II [Pseudomonadota bacterium]|nr:signal peptidase II [Pseudomonadota bacterium]